ncbi:hypothetical protein CR513_47167, partial [Mucuna pruriens]
KGKRKSLKGTRVSRRGVIPPKAKRKWEHLLPLFPPNEVSLSVLSAWGKSLLPPKCPNRRTMVLRENGEVKSESSQEDTSSSSIGESSSEGFHYEGDLLMVRRIMRNLIEKETESQRKTIFHYRCLLCSLIIDGVSRVNVASLRLVEKLALPHPRAYNEKGKLVVYKQVSLTITLGSYKDDILCDVVPMEVTYILLGRL